MKRYCKQTLTLDRTRDKGKTSNFVRIFSFREPTELGRDATLLCHEHTGGSAVRETRTGAIRGRLLEIDEDEGTLIDAYALLHDVPCSAVLVRDNESKQFFMARLYAHLTAGEVANGSI